MRKYTQEYALYKGDKLLIVGNVEECAKYLGIKKETVYWYSSLKARTRNITGNRIIAERIGR